jgi:hypothetical protein
MDRAEFVRAMMAATPVRHEIEEVNGGRRTIVAVGRVVPRDSTPAASVDAGADGPRRFTAVLAYIGEDWEITALHTSVPVRK